MPSYMITNKIPRVIVYACLRWIHGTVFCSNILFAKSIDIYVRGYAGYHCCVNCWCPSEHYSDVIMSSMASPITSLTVVFSNLIQAQINGKIKAPRRGLCEGNSPVTGDPQNGPVTRKMFPFDGVIMSYSLLKSHAVSQKYMGDVYLDIRQGM